MSFKGYIRQKKSFSWFDTRSVDSTLQNSKPLKVATVAIFQGFDFPVEVLFLFIID
jgi:hypothetical protein